MSVTLYDERGSIVHTTSSDVEVGGTDATVRERFGATLLFADGDRGVVGAYCKAAGSDHPVQRYAEGRIESVTPAGIRVFVATVADALGVEGTEPRPLERTDSDDTHRPFALVGETPPPDPDAIDAEGLDRLRALLDAGTPVDVLVEGAGYDEAVEAFELLATRLADDGRSVALTPHGRISALDDVDVVVRPGGGDGDDGTETVRVTGTGPVTFTFADSTTALVRIHRVEAAADDLAAAIEAATDAGVDESTVYDRVRTGLRSVTGDVVRTQEKARLGLRWLATGLAVGTAIGFAFRRTLYVVEAFYWRNPRLSQLLAAGMVLLVVLAGLYVVTQRTEGRLNQSTDGSVAVSLSYARILLVVSLLVLGLLVLVTGL